MFSERNDIMLDAVTVVIIPAHVKASVSNRDILICLKHRKSA